MRGKCSVIYVPGERSAGEGLQGAQCRQPLQGLSKQGNEADQSPRKLSGNVDRRMLTMRVRLYSFPKLYGS